MLTLEGVILWTREVHVSFDALECVDDERGDVCVCACVRVRGRGPGCIGGWQLVLQLPCDMLAGLAGILLDVGAA